jgi:hypothetical protein
MNQQTENILATLHRGQQVTVIYDGRFEQQRLRITGKVGKVDHLWGIHHFTQQAQRLH